MTRLLVLLSCLAIPALGFAQDSVQRDSNPPLDARYILERADRDGNGHVSREEVDYLRGSGDGRGAWRIVQRYFDQFDLDGNGMLDARELTGGFAQSAIEDERQYRREGLRHGQP